MCLDKTKKAEILAQHSKTQGTTDIGSAESQIALFSYHIRYLTGHVKKNRRDYVTTRSSTQLVGKRRALLDYLYNHDVKCYRVTIKALGLRK